MKWGDFYSPSFGEINFSDPDKTNGYTEIETKGYSWGKEDIKWLRKKLKKISKKIKKD